MDINLDINTTVTSQCKLTKYSDFYNLYVIKKYKIYFFLNVLLYCYRNLLSRKFDLPVVAQIFATVPLNIVRNLYQIT